MSYSPQNGGFRTFYSAIVDARDAILVDISRARTSFEAMEAVNATMTKLMAQYAIVAARPKNEGALMERLAKEGYGAVGGFLERQLRRHQGGGSVRLRGLNVNLLPILAPFRLSRPRPNLLKDINL